MKKDRLSRHFANGLVAGDGDHYRLRPEAIATLSASAIGVDSESPNCDIRAPGLPRWQKDNSMIPERRQFLMRTGTAAIAGALASSSVTAASAEAAYRAILFDAFPIFDPRPIAQLASAIYGDKASELMRVWRSRQFEYQWLRALSNKYVDFWRSTEDSLVFAARQTGLAMTPQQREQLMGGYSNLTIWPDVPDALAQLRKAGFRLGFLSNMTAKLLESGIAKANLHGVLEYVLSTDQARTYKPARAAYQIGVDALGLERRKILFVPFAGWDAAGAKWFGYPTFWVNRAGSFQEELDASPDGTGTDLHSLVSFVLR